MQSYVCVGSIILIWTGWS